LFTCKIFTTSSVFLYGWPISNICCECPDLALFFFFMWSLHLVLKLWHQGHPTKQ
jgi:hypothetical protein